MSKYGHRPYNWHEAIANKLGGEEQADRFLRGELSVSKLRQRWSDHGGIIYLPPVTSDGTTGSQWIERLERNAFYRQRSDHKKGPCFGRSIKVYQAKRRSCLFDQGKLL